MTGTRTTRHLFVLGFAATSVLIGTGWCLNASAWQRSARPYIPRPSEVHPLSRGQAQASQLPGPLPSDKTGTILPPAQPPAKPNDPAQKYGQFQAASGTVDENTGMITARDFVYTVDDMKVTGVNGRYNKDTKVLDAENNLALDNPKHHVTGDKAHVDNGKAKLAVFTGNVVIVIKPKDKSAELGSADIASEKSKGGTITCDHVDDYYKKQFVILRGHLTFKQKITKKNGATVERTLTADHAEYDGKNDKMHLFAPVELVDTDDQKGHFKDDVFIGTKEGEETLKTDGPANFIFIIPEDKDDSEDTPAGKTPVSTDTPTGSGKREKPPAGTEKQNPPPAGTDTKQNPPPQKSQ